MQPRRQTETTEEPTTSNPTDESTDVSTDDPIVDPTEDETVIPPEEQDPANATAVDGSMSVSLPDDWTYRGELETAYSVFFWTKSDNSQNLSMAPLGPWAQIRVVPRPISSSSRPQEILGTLHSPTKGN